MPKRDNGEYRYSGIPLDIRMMMFSGLKSIGNTYSNALNIVMRRKK